MANGQKRRLDLAAAAAAGALILTVGPSASAQPPGGCPRAGSDSVDQTYRFTFDSFETLVVDPVRGDRWRIVHCLFNRHPTRNVFVDWPDAGIKGWVRAGTRGSAIRNGPAARRIEQRDGVLWFGSRPRKRVVTTPVLAAGPAPGRFALDSRPNLIRAAYQSAPAAPADSWTSSASIDVPVTRLLEPFLARLAPKGGGLGAAALKRAAFKKLVKYVEARPEALVRFEMTFATQPSPEEGGPGLRYSCTYRVAGDVLLRFDDPELHRTMFGNDAPFHASYTRGPPMVMRSERVATAGGVDSRSGRLEILLPDGATVIGSIGFDYLAPTGA